MKLEEKDEKNMRGLSKAIYIIAKICKVLCIVGIPFVVLALVLIPLLFSKVKVENQTITAFDDVIVVTEEDDALVLKVDNKVLVST